MQALRTVIDAPELHAGFVVGIGSLAIGGLVEALWRRRGAYHGTPPGIIGPAVVGATVVALGGPGPFAQVSPVPGRVVVALAALWLAGEVGARTTPLIGCALGVVAGAALVDGAAQLPVWIVAILVLGPAFAGTAVADLDRRTARSGLGTHLLFISVAGLYATVPDTELALVLLGAMVPITLLTWPWVLARIGSGGAYAAMGLFLWVATLEGTPRPGSIVGAVATLGLLLGEPIGCRIAARRAPVERHRSRNPARIGTGTFIMVQLLLTLYAARVAGRVDDAIVAAVLAVPVLAIGVVLGHRVAVDPPRRRAKRRGGETSSS